ncbi:MAG: hypothetical protein IPG58_03585 [Acidobacteria bacterium]|nr:hypothetical protein [Acidobacteriota bacterium]
MKGDKVTAHRSYSPSQSTRRGRSVDARSKRGLWANSKSRYDLAADLQAGEKAVDASTFDSKDRKPLSFARKRIDKEVRRGIVRSVGCIAQQIFPLSKQVDVRVKP